MMLTYGTIDFDNLIEEIKEEINRLENCYCIYDRTHDGRVYDYNRMTSALLILRDIESC